MLDRTDFIDNKFFNFVGPVVFTIVFLTFIVIGYFQNKKSILFFSTISVFSLIIGIIVGALTAIPIAASIKNEMTINQEKIEISNLLKESRGVLNTFSIPFFIFVFYISFSLIGLIVYLVWAKKHEFITINNIKTFLSKKLIKNKKAQKKKIKNIWVSKTKYILLTLLIFAPFIFVTTSLASLMGKASGFEKFNNWGVIITTFGSTRLMRDVVMGIDDLTSAITEIGESTGGFLTLNMNTIFGNAQSVEDGERILNHLLTNSETRGALNSFINHSIPSENMHIINIIENNAFKDIMINDYKNIPEYKSTVNLPILTSIDSLRNFADNSANAINNSEGKALSDVIVSFFLKANIVRLIP